MLFTSSPNQKQRGFTLIELLVVIAIVGVLASVILFAMENARIKGRDGARKSQVLEVLKALELHYSINGIYPPLAGGSTGTGNYLSNIDNSFFGTGKAIIRLPDNSATEYYYCVSSNQTSMMIAVNTEQDKGGSNFCNITRGTGPSYGCDVWLANNAVNTCLSRF